MTLTFVLCRFGYIEIYKEKIYDLLNERQPVLIDQNKKFDFLLSNDEIIVENYEKAVETVFNGSYKRKSSAEDGSKLSNLSHSIFRIVSLALMTGSLQTNFHSDSDHPVRR